MILALHYIKRLVINYGLKEKKKNNLSEIGKKTFTQRYLDMVALYLSIGEYRVQL